MMDTNDQAAQWQPLESLQGQFAANVAAVSARDAGLGERMATHRPSCEYVVGAAGAQIALARREGQAVVPLRCVVPPDAARAVAARLYPQGKYNSAVAIVGIDLGWLWDVVWRLPPHDPGQPGHRPPIWLLCGQVEQLWLAAHLHDWRELLADPRVQLFVGGDCVQQLQRALMDHTLVPWPRASVTLDPSLWPAGTKLENLLLAARQEMSRRVATASAQAKGLYASASPQVAAGRLRSGQSLHILGLTSRYTTFLQHSMRDWLGAFERLGHQTRLIIERADHEVTNELLYAQACADFRPDLIVMIDHYRREFGGFVEPVPCVMWVQDRLPNIFSAAAASAQGPWDYCLGFGRLHLSAKYGYPSKRFMSSMVGSDTARFAPREPSASERDRYACDVSYVSHASTPADVLLQRQLDRTPSDLSRRLLRDVYDRIVAHYDAGGHALGDPDLGRLLDQSMQSLRCAVPQEQMPPIVSFFQQQINNAVFRHQAIGWVADLGVDLRLYGRGWEEHPRLGRYARGIADNQNELGVIHQASRINLQVTPFGAVHQRLLDGLAAGGFFLVRWTRGDAVGTLYQRLWECCQAQGIATAQRIPTSAQAAAIVAQIERLLGGDYFSGHGASMFEVLSEHADSGFVLSASSLWPQYEQVAFRDRQDLAAKVARYLADEPARRGLADAMRQVVVGRCSYESIARRLLEFIANDLMTTGASECV
jgi:hypothetical protein